MNHSPLGRERAPGTEAVVVEVQARQGLQLPERRGDRPVQTLPGWTAEHPAGSAVPQA